MKLPLQIRFLGMEPSEALESAARKKADKLDQLCPSIMSCHVNIEQTHKHQHQGRPADDGLQVVSLRTHHSGGHRNHSHDQEGATRLWQGPTLVSSRQVLFP